MQNRECSGRLELTWTNKHHRLLAHRNEGYEWVPLTITACPKCAYCLMLF